MKTSGNTVLITGGASGIGLALAKAFQHNNTVIICGRDREKLNRVRLHFPKIHTIECDITKGAELAELQSQLSARFPALNIVVNNAGIQKSMDFKEAGVDESLIRQEIDTNFTAQINITNRLLPQLSAQPAASIVFVSSALARVPKMNAPVYCATKAAIHSFVQSLRMQLRRTRIQVTEVVPDLVDTAMTADRPNATKTKPEALANSVITGIRNDHSEILIGRTGMLFSINHLSSRLAQHIINKNLP